MEPEDNGIDYGCDFFFFAIYTSMTYKRTLQEVS